MKHKLMVAGGLALAGWFAALSLPASAARRVTVAQLGEVVSNTEAAHRADLDAARQIGDLEMSERLTDRALGHLAATHKLGPRTALALQLLADQSVFLDPPPNEIPATALPDAQTQDQMLSAARAYSVQTWDRMPNFFVTRVTNRFDDAPHVLEKGGWPVRAGLQPVGSSSRQVTFRNGKEVQDTLTETAATPGKAEQELGLHSWGEFGPALFVVLSDIAKGKVTFSHWEETQTAAAGGTNSPRSTQPALVAVFRYSVPRASSHYNVNYCCIRDAKSIGSPRVNYSNERGRGAGPSPYLANSIDLHPFIETPGYHGILSIDPATGTVVRITIETELSGGDPLSRAATAIEYGRIQIGDASYYCPIRSLALSTEDGDLATLNGGSQSRNGDSAWKSPATSGSNNPVVLINETRFIDYHRLGSTIRILTDAANTGQNPPGDDASTHPGVQAAAPASAEAPEIASSATPSAPSALPSTEVATTPPPAAPPATPPAPPAEPAIPEISMNAATGVPDEPADGNQHDSEFSIKVTSRLVDVGLVAYDKKGNPVTDLKPDDLEVFDNGHKQEIRSFALAGAAQLATAAATPATSPATLPSQDPPEPSFSNRANDTTAPSTASPSDVGSTILVIDESHIAWNDMSYARGQILKFLASLGPAERVGIYSMTGLGFRVLNEVTTDHATLIARMQKFVPSAQSLAQAQEEETRNRQHFDVVHNAADLNSVNGNHADVSDFASPVDPQLLTMGDDPTRASFIILAQVARHLASIPGHKKVVWVSSDNVLADWRDQTVGTDKTAKDDSAYALHAQEALNEAHAAVYPFDVSQLEVGGVGADLQHANVQLTQAASDNAATAASAGGGGSVVGNRDTSSGRITATMSQDLHPVQGPVRQVAAATGGRVIRRSGDLTAQLDRIIADGHATYMVSFSPQGPADGQYHTINVKVNGRRGLNLSFRTGYVFDKEPVTLKERFQQAIWRPVDVSEIAVSAQVSSASDGADIKINIATKDLGLRQQAGRWIDRLDIFFIQRDDAGLHARVEGQTLGLKLKSSTYEKLIPEGVPFQHFVAAKPGAGSLRVLVVDENSGRMGSVTIPSSAMGAGQGE